MTRICAIAAACILALADSTTAQKTETLSLRVAGKTRSAIIHLPAGINKPPVVFCQALRAEVRNSMTLRTGA